MAIRSPGYPAISLEEAIEKARVMYQHDKRSGTSTTVLAGHWNYSSTSSGARLAIAALKKFGLLESVGSKKSGEVRLSPLALQILLDEREHSPEREQAIKTAALSPDLYSELWEKWGPDLPSDATIKTYLRLHRGFNDTTVGDFLKDYKKTISFANLGAGDKISGDDSSAGEAGVASPSASFTTPSPMGVSVHGDSQPRLSGGRGSLLTLPFPLIGGGMATLSVPIPLSKKNYLYLKQLVNNTLEGMEQAIVEAQMPSTEVHDRHLSDAD